jgi:hypothetical protein
MQVLNRSVLPIVLQVSLERPALLYRLRKASRLLQPLAGRGAASPDSSRCERSRDQESHRLANLRHSVWCAAQCEWRKRQEDPEATASRELANYSEILGSGRREDQAERVEQHDCIFNVPSLKKAGRARRTNARRSSGFRRLFLHAVVFVLFLSSCLSPSKGGKVFVLMAGTTRLEPAISAVTGRGGQYLIETKRHGWLLLAL